MGSHGTGTNPVPVSAPVVTPPVVTFSRGLPIPGTRDAPLFNGRYINDFLTTLHKHAEAAGLQEDKLPSLIYQYCTDEVKAVIRYSKELEDTSTWAVAKKHLLDLYGSLDEPSLVSIDTVLSFCRQAGLGARFNSRQDLASYHRQFHAMSAPLIKKNLWTTTEANLHFFKGLPSEHRTYIYQNVDAKFRTRTNPPTIDTCVQLVSVLFDPDQINALEPEPLTGHDLLTDEPLQKTVRFEQTPPPQPVRVETAVPPQTTAQAPANIDDLTHRFRELSLQMAQLLAMQAAAIPVGAGKPNQQPSNQPPQSDFHRRCFMCGQAGMHPERLRNCPETTKLVNEGFIKFDFDSNRFVLSNGVELPQAPRGIAGGLAAYIRSAFMSLGKGTTTGTVKGKEVERDPPPHQSGSFGSSAVGLIVDGQSVFEGDVFAVSSFSDPSHEVYSVSSADLEAFPATRSQTSRDAARDQAAPYSRPPAKSSNNPSPTAQRTVKTTQDQANSTIRPPLATSLRPATSTPRPNIPPSAPQPPPVNTQVPARKTNTAPPPAAQDINMKDTPAKKGPQFHFTTDIQDRYSPDDIEKKVWNQSIMLSIGELVSVAPVLQKRISTATQTRRQYLNNAGEYELYTAEAERLLAEEYSSSCVEPGDQFCVTDPEELSSFLVTYSNAVTLRPTRFFAMTTGQFEARLGNLPSVRFMVDTGSELNLMPERLVNEASLPVDFEGSRWALKGVNGGPVRLLGCCMDVPIVIGTHNFDHHFFVKSEDTGTRYDVILGQPWIQWYATQINYNRAGKMWMNIWKDGDRESQPTLQITLTRPDNDRNSEKLVMSATAPGRQGPKSPGTPIYLSPNNAGVSESISGSVVRPTMPRIEEVFEEADFPNGVGPAAQR